MKKQKTLPLWKFAIVYVLVIAACIGLDQLTKILIFDKLLEAHPGNGINVMGKFLRFYAVYNAGASFGIGQSDSANILFFIVTIIGIPAFLFLLWRSRTRSVVGQVGFAFIVGGTIGNAIDRAVIQTTKGQFFSGKVRDFISFSIFPPVFNVADSFLVVGVFLAILALIFFDHDSLVSSYKQERAKKLANNDGSERINSDATEQPNATLDELQAEQQNQLLEVQQAADKANSTEHLSAEQTQAAQTSTKPIAAEQTNAEAVSNEKD